MLPFEPEMIEQQQARYAAALEAIYDPDTDLATNRPGLKREHVFDSHDGVRVIISRDRMFGDNRVVIHFSASVSEGTWEYMRLQRMRGDVQAVQKEFAQIGESRFREISGYSGGVLFLGFSDHGKGVPHWYCKGE